MFTSEKKQRMYLINKTLRQLMIECWENFLFNFSWFKIDLARKINLGVLVVLS